MSKLNLTQNKKAFGIAAAIAVVLVSIPLVVSLKKHRSPSSPTVPSQGPAVTPGTAPFNSAATGQSQPASSTPDPLGLASAPVQTSPITMSTPAGSGQPSGVAGFIKNLFGSNGSASKSATDQKSAASDGANSDAGKAAGSNAAGANGLAGAPVAVAPIAGTNGAPHSAVGVNGTPLAQASATPAEVKPETGCFTVTYSHKALAGHRDADSCAQHRNLIRLKHENVNAKSVCVRVDGVPAAFTVQKNEKTGMALLIGAHATPDSKISVKYCLAKETCAEDCTIPKDEFMDALAGHDRDDEEVAIAKHKHAGKWSADAGAEEDGAVSAAVEAELERELASDSTASLSVFDGWQTAAQAQKSACTATEKKNIQAGL